jgi:hypothetical protein
VPVGRPWQAARRPALAEGPSRSSREGHRANLYSPRMTTAILVVGAILVVAALLQAGRLARRGDRAPLLLVGGLIAAAAILAGLALVIQGLGLE